MHQTCLTIVNFKKTLIENDRAGRVPRLGIDLIFDIMKCVQLLTGGTANRVLRATSLLSDNMATAYVALLTRFIYIAFTRVKRFVEFRKSRSCVLFVIKKLIDSQTENSIGTDFFKKSCFEINDGKAGLMHAR